MEKIKVLAVRPMEKPEVVEIEKSLDGYYSLLECDCIQAVYPWGDPVALVCDDEGKLSGKMLNRALKGPDGKVYDVVAGNFFICGIGRDDFCSIPDDMAKKYAEMFNAEEMYLRDGKTGGVYRVVMDGSEPAMLIG